MRSLATVCIILGLTAAVQAQSPTTRIRGEVEKAEGDTLMVKTVDGASAKIALASGYSVGGVVKATAADIKKGGFVGVGARPQPDGSLLAVQVFIFPEAMRGTGEGYRPFDVRPGSTMTNAAVDTTVVGTDGQVITVKYKDGEKKFVVPADAPIVAFVPGARDELKPGAKIILFNATKQPDGTIQAVSVTVGRDGLTPPM
jgi:hypothetical protein